MNVNCVYFCYYCFNGMLGNILYEIMLELYVLVRTISWPGGLALTWHWEGHGFKPW